MKQRPGFFSVFRFAGLLAIVIFGLVSIVGTGGDSGSGGSSPEFDGVLYHLDADGDGYGNPNISIRSVSQPEGYVSDYTDCDDNNPNINPGAKEDRWDNIDNNCDGVINEGNLCTDTDGDGFYAQMGCGTELDCDDTNAEIYPGAVDIYCDGVDGNCNGEVDENCTCTDKDRDGYYVESGCGADLDCDDNRFSVYPGARELCGDGIDNDCDGFVDELCPSIPDTGQTTCYDNEGLIISCPMPDNAFYGQDASYTVNPPSYTKLGYGGKDLPGEATSWAMVRDNVTGLTWEVKTDNSGIQDKDKLFWYASSEELINSLNRSRLGGYSDWRLPTKKELISLVNYGSYGAGNPMIDTRYFPNTQPSDYWSSTKSACLAGLRWQIDFASGVDKNRRDADFAFVRAVRGQPLSLSFRDNGDGTVTDRTTGLMWMQATADADGNGVVSAGDSMNWQEALNWCEKASLAGYTDWRLPTIKELNAIVDYDEQVHDPVIDTGFFPDTRSAEYWSATTANTDFRDYAWAVDFICGDVIQGRKGYQYYVRAVRGGQ